MTLKNIELFLCNKILKATLFSIELMCPAPTFYEQVIADSMVIYAVMPVVGQNVKA